MTGRLARVFCKCSCVILFVSCLSCNSRPVLHKAQRILMGTFVEVSVVALPTQAEAAAQSVLDEIARIEDLTSFHKSSSLTRINEMAGFAPVEADPELVFLIGEALRFAELSRGAFDPTIGAVTKLWGFSGEGPARVPQEIEIREALTKVDWRLVHIDPESRNVFLPIAGMEIDLGGLAKGYALDRVRAVLAELGISSALVNIGGDILALGEKSPGIPWRVGVQNPRNPSALRAVASIKDQLVLTSGDYQRCIEVDGKRYHHILNPTTGYPASALQSVTLVAPTGLTAPPAALFVLGVEKGLHYIEHTLGLAGLLVDCDGNVHLSSNAAQIFEVR